MSESKNAPTPNNEVKKGIGLDENMIGFLSYFFSPWSGILLYLTEKDTPHWENVKLYIYQSLYLQLIISGATIVLVVVLSILSIFTCGLSYFCIFPIYLVNIYYIYLAIKALQGEKVRVPIISEWVK